MALTHAEIVTQVEEDTGRTDKTTEIGAYVYRAQNIIVRDASQMNHDFSFLKIERTADTVDGTKTYTFPSDMKSLYNIRICESSKSRKLRTLTPMYQDTIRPYPEGDSEGIPIRYIPWGRYFDLSPIPDNAYTMYLRCLKWPSEQTTAVVSDLLYMDEVIIKCTDWLTVLALNLEKDIRRFRSEYEELMRAAVRSDAAEHKYEAATHVTPFVGGRTSLEPGDKEEYWLKPSWGRTPG